MSRVWQKLQDCRSNSNKRNEKGRRVFRTEVNHDVPELSVILQVKINGNPVTAILDSGAGPSVLDYDTLRDLGLTNHLR